MNTRSKLIELDSDDISVTTNIIFGLIETNSDDPIIENLIPCNYYIYRNYIILADTKAIITFDNFYNWLQEDVSLLDCNIRFNDKNIIYANNQFIITSI
jgi:hypothetical protein